MAGEEACRQKLLENVKRTSSSGDESDSEDFSRSVLLLVCISVLLVSFVFQPLPSPCVHELWTVDKQTGKMTVLSCRACFRAYH